MHRVRGWRNDLITGIKRAAGWEKWQKWKLRHRISLESFNTTVGISPIFMEISPFALHYRHPLNLNMTEDVCNMPEPVMLTSLEVLLILNLTNL